MPSLGEAPSGGAKTFWLLLGRLPKVTRCKSGTLSSRYLNNGYVLKKNSHPETIPPALRCYQNCSHDAHVTPACDLSLRQGAIIANAVTHLHT